MQSVQNRDQMEKESWEREERERRKMDVSDNLKHWK